MNLKSIRESYAKFIKVLETAGIKLNESQKADLDSFILTVESKMQKQKEMAVKATKKIVTEHLEAQYKKAFKSILEHQAEHAEIATKIQKKVTAIKESKKLARKLNNYLEMYVESVLPKKTIVDYDRMQKLEKLTENLKELLVVDDDSVQQKKQELQESFDAKRKELETQLAKTQVKLNESMDKVLKLNKKIDSIKAIELLESKTKDLPSYESEQIKKRFANATTTEIEKNFKKVLESVKDEMNEDEKKEETSIEEEVKNIIEGEENVKENDVLKGKHHNNHVDEGEEEDVDEGEDENLDEDELFETRESVQFDEDGNVILDKADVINEYVMDLWCSQVI